MKKRRITFTLSISMSTLMILTMPITALAGEWDIAVGDIAVNRTSETEQNVSQGSRSENDTNPTITGSSSYHTVTIEAATGTTATVTLEDAHIESSSDNAPISTQGNGNVTIELDGNNSITSLLSNEHASLEKNNSGNLTITDSDETPSGSINAIGSIHAAGIGGGNNRDGSNITISGNAIVTASSYEGAAIGGGENRNGSNITISGNANVTAYSNHGAGVGGGLSGNGSDIKISGNAIVTASSSGGSGIGGGFLGNGSNIKISENATIDASSIGGAGIGGGGESGNGSEITISDNTTVIATSSNGSAGIGGGDNGDGSHITISGNANVTASGSRGSAGIGGGCWGNGSDIFICENATVHVAGGIFEGYYGSSIGNGVSYDSVNDELFNGSENVDTSNLTTGSITRYDPGTTVDQIKAFIAQSQSQSGQQSQVDSQQNPPIVSPVAIITEDNESDAPEAIPTRGGSSHSSDNNSVTVNTPVPNIDYALFVAALNQQIEDYIKQLYEAINSGNTDKANAMIKEGLKLNLGNFVGLNSKTIALLEEVSKAGIATTIDFTYKNIGYRTSIPANAEITPTSLLNKDGYCGALNLMKEYGRIEEIISPSDIISR